MTVRLAVTLAAFFMKHDDLLTADMSAHRGEGFCALAAIGKQDVIEQNLLTFFGARHIGHAKRLHGVVDLELLSGYFDDCEHNSLSFLRRALNAKNGRKVRLIPRQVRF